MNKEQQNAYDLMNSGLSILLTGAGGTGKSYVIKKYYDEMVKKYGEECISKTSSTGISAVLIGGKTIHSYLGIGLAKDSAEKIFEYTRYKLSHTVKKLRALKVLIIDEISMLDIELFEKISKYLMLVRYNSKPFGGLQLVLTGDFCQLEPVSGDYCFKAKEWSELKLKTVYLHKLIRQDGDLIFQNILLY